MLALAVSLVCAYAAGHESINLGICLVLTASCPKPCASKSCLKLNSPMNHDATYTEEPGL